MKFNENLLKCSGDMEQTQKCYGRNNGLTKGIPIMPQSVHGRGLINQK